MDQGLGHYEEFNSVLRQASKVALEAGDALHATEFDKAIRVHSLNGCDGLDVCFYPTVARNYVNANSGRNARGEVR